MKNSEAKKSVIEKTLSIIAWFIFIIALLTALLSIFASFSSEKNGKEIFGVKFLIVASDSMSKSPISENEQVFFDAGDVIIIKTTKDNTNFKVGDVITFVSYNPDSYGKTLTHKIKEVNYSSSGKLIGYTTYGINTGKNDKVSVSPDTIIGVYSGKIPKLGNILAYLKTPAGYYLSILTPSVLLIIFFSINVGRYFGKKEALTEQTTVNTSQKITNLQIRVAVLEKEIKTSRATTKQIEQNKDISQTETTTTEELAFAIANASRTTFVQRFLRLDEKVKQYFDNLHNELCSYKKVHDRLSNKCMSYRVGRKLLAKITVRGKTLKLHLALDVSAFNKNVYHQNNLSSVKTYQEVPFTVKVKSERAKKNALKLIESLMSKNGAVKNQKYKQTNQIEILKNKTTNFKENTL